MMIYSHLVNNAWDATTEAASRCNKQCKGGWMEGRWRGDKVNI